MDGVFEDELNSDAATPESSSYAEGLEFRSDIELLGPKFPRRDTDRNSLRLDGILLVGSGPISRSP
jgi:hypothetical protein